MKPNEFGPTIEPKWQVCERLVKEVKGSVELAPLVGLADGIVDLVDTGRTLDENGLEIVEEISAQFPLKRFITPEEVANVVAFLVSDAGSGTLGELASGAADAVSGADEGAVVVIPVVAIFLIGAAVVFGAGSLALLFFGWDVLLTVAVELAFSVATARAAMGVEREGWLGAAVRLTWKPMLGALVCAVVLGATIDHFLPQVNSLPEAVRVLQSHFGS